MEASPLARCYEKMQGNYSDVMARLGKEERVQRFLLMFLQDDSFELLCQAMAQENYSEAFRAAHTLKGVCGNLSLSQLGSSAAALTESLRGGTLREDSQSLYQLVAANYANTFDAVTQLQKALGR